MIEPGLPSIKFGILYVGKLKTQELTLEHANKLQKQERLLISFSCV